MQATRADGPKMRAAREAADLTVDELLAKLAKQGIVRSPITIYNVELGHTQPGLKLYNAICRILRVSRDSLLLRDEATGPAQPPDATDEAVRVRNVERGGPDALPELPDGVLRTGA